MGGIINTALQDDPASADPNGESADDQQAEGQQSAPPSGDMLPGQQAATPQEQQAFDQAVALATKALTAKGAVDRMLAMVKGGGLENGIAQTVVTLVEQVDKRINLPETVILGFATEMTTRVWALCAKAKLVREDDQEKMGSVLQAVFKGLSQIYDFDPQEAAQIAQQMAQSSGEPVGDSSQQAGASGAADQSSAAGQTPPEAANGNPQ